MGIDVAKLKAKIVSLQKQKQSHQIAVERCNGALDLANLLLAEYENEQAAKTANAQ